MERIGVNFVKITATEITANAPFTNGNPLPDEEYTLLCHTRNMANANLADNYDGFTMIDTASANSVPYLHLVY